MKISKVAALPCRGPKAAHNDAKNSCGSKQRVGEEKEATIVELKDPWRQPTVAGRENHKVQPKVSTRDWLCSVF